MTDLVAVVPLTTSLPSGGLLPRVAAGRGLERDCTAAGDAVRSLARPRLLRRLGQVSEPELVAIGVALTIILDLGKRLVGGGKA
jgi:mRNA-degrading endonuclease toxin of MazEF toxin-antitoxin module